MNILLEMRTTLNTLVEKMGEADSHSVLKKEDNDPEYIVSIVDIIIANTESSFLIG